MYVVKEGDITDAMYFIHTGKVQEIAAELEKAPISKVYLAKSCFGIGLVRDTPYTYSYQTTNKSQVLTLHLDDWEYLLAHFPESKSSIHKLMKQGPGKDVDSSKWPGGKDSEPPPETETEKDTGVSNLPNFFPYDNRRMFEAGPSGQNARQNSTESSSSYLSKDMPNTDEAKTRKSIRRMTTESLTPSLLGGPNEDKTTSVLVPESNEFKSKEKHYVGILKTISNILKKLMGRYSGMDLTREETEAEEEATQALLKQLDEARRLIGEMEKKNRYRSNKRVNTFPKEEEEEEDTEKYVISLDKSSFIEDSTEEPHSATLLPRPLQIRDEQAHTITHKNIESSESSQMTNLSRDVNATPSIGTSLDIDSKPKDENDDNITSIDKSETKENTQIVHNFEELEKQLNPNIQETDNSKVDEKVEELPYQVSSYIAEAAPDWMTEVIQENDADIEDIPDKSKEGLKEDASSQNNLNMPVSSEPENNTIRNSQIRTSSHSQVTQETDADIEPLPISEPVYDKDVNNSNEKLNNKSSIDQDKVQNITLTDRKSLENQRLSDGTFQDRRKPHSRTSMQETEDADIAMIPTIINSQSDVGESHQQQFQITEIETVPDADIPQEELKVPSEELPLTNKYANNNLRPVSSKVISSEVDEVTRISSTTNTANDDENAEIPSTSKDTSTSKLKRRKPFVPIKYDDEKPTSSKTVSENNDEDTEETAKSEAKNALSSGSDLISSNPKDKESKNEPRS
ncbi:unnamed protein product [Arctia plantaginis]|nr:unnamed protein product [Arctia plantaginis]